MARKQKVVVSPVKLNLSQVNHLSEELSKCDHGSHATLRVEFKGGSGKPITIATLYQGDQMIRGVRLQENRYPPRGEQS